MPTKSPETMVITSESTPLKYTSRITRRKRAKLVAEAAITRQKKRAMVPTRQMPSMKLWPRRASGRRTSSMGVRLQPHVGRVGSRGIVDRHRAVGLAAHELAHVRERGAADLPGRALAHDSAVRDEI